MFANVQNEEKIYEIDIQRKLEREYGCGHQKCSRGTTDILTPTTIIEIKNWNNWKNALGQLRAYNVDYPDRDMRVHFFGKQPNMETKIKIVETFTINNIFVTWETENSSKNKCRDIRDDYYQKIMELVRSK